MPTVYPGASWRPLSTEQTQPAMRSHEVICLHTIVGYLTSTDAMFRRQGYGGTESHFGVGGRWGSDGPAGLDGAVWQWQDLNYTADANYQGNGRVISIETADNAPARPEDIEAWTPAQVESLVELVTWLCQTYDIPPEIIADTRPGTRGIGWHALGTSANLPPGAEQWSTTVGKPCPTARRINQIRTVIVPRVQQALRGEDMTPEQHAMLVKCTQAADQILGAVGSGQTSFAATLKATLSTAQGIVNLVNARTGALGAALTDTRTAVLSAVATVDTGHLSPEQVDQLAERLGEVLVTAGVPVDSAALLDALAVRLTRVA